MLLLPTVELEPDTPADASIIWLHGLGADGHDFVSVAESLDLPAVRFIFPHAPQRPVTINGGYAMRAWYDIYAADIAARQDAEGIAASRQMIEKLIAREKGRGISAQRILLAGFSQGGAIALYTGLRHAEKLAGILALSTYLPLHERLQREKTPANRQTPIFMAHGLFDDVIPLQIGRASADLLEQQDYRVNFFEYPMPHSVCGEEIADMRDFIRTCLAENNPKKILDLLRQPT